MTVSTFTRRPATSIITRGVLIEPTLYLAFPRKMMAHIASSQHLCLCRNEDVLLPTEAYKVTIGEWHSDLFPGFELTFGKDSAPQINVGLNRYADAQPMFGELRSFGKPIQDCVMIDSFYEQQNKLFDTKEAIIPFTRNRITSLVTAACNTYKTSQLGGIHNLKITVTNNTCFLLENVKVKVTYFKATGAVWSVQTIDFSLVRPNSTSSIALPDTTGGTTVKYNIVTIKASSLAITELKLE